MGTTTATRTVYVVESGVVGDHPMWTAIRQADDRLDALRQLDDIAHDHPRLFGPAGSRRLRVRQVQR